MKFKLETNNPTILQRSNVTQPLLTGTFLIDTLTPIDRGQRELALDSNFITIIKNFKQDRNTNNLKILHKEFNKHLNKISKTKKAYSLALAVLDIITLNSSISFHIDLRIKLNKMDRVPERVICTHNYIKFNYISILYGINKYGKYNTILKSK